MQLATDERGQDLIEYALLSGMVAVAAGAIFPTTVAPNISTIFSKIEHTLGLA
jgi:Flp pilus assembly pilin Flp